MLLSRLAGVVMPAVTGRASMVSFTPRIFAAQAQRPTQQSLAPSRHTANYSEDASPAAVATAGPTAAPTGRVYSHFYVYKTRSALCLRLLPPTFSTAGGAKILERDGVMMLEFANANPTAAGAQPNAAGSINRTYNWGSKVTFALSPVELGNILAGDALVTDKGLVLFHDPAKLGKKGEPMKKMTLKQMPDGNISFSINAGIDNMQVPVSKGEFEVFKSVAQFAIPRLLGFDTQLGAQ